MKIEIRGASEHNLKGIDVCIGDGLTVVTGGLARAKRRWCLIRCTMKLGGACWT